MIIVSSAPSFFWGLSTDQWQAIAAIATAGAFMIAAVAAGIAIAQLIQNRHTRLDQNRPYIVVSFRPGISWTGLIDIVIENVGAGPARDVTIRVDPPLKRAQEDDRFPVMSARYFNGTIPLIPPGYVMRTFYDSASERIDRSDLPTEHTFTVAYSDGRGHVFNDVFVDDMSVLNGLLMTEQYSTHHVGKALRENAKLLKGSPIVKGKPLDVVTEDRESRLARVKSENKEWERRAKERQAAGEAASTDANPEQL